MDATAVNAREAMVPWTPFAGAGLAPEAPPDHRFEAPPGGVLLSPFSEGYLSAEEADRDQRAMEALLTELEDEEFESALEALVDEAAARHLQAGPSWPSDSEAPVLPTSEVEAWMAQLAAEADGVLERLEVRFADRPAESLADGEVEAAASEALEDRGIAGGAMEQFLGGIVRKAINVGKGIAKAGLSVLGKVLPTGLIFSALRKLLGPLLRWVLGKAINRLPAKVRPMAQDVARRLLGESQEADSLAEAATRFDVQLAEAILAPTDSAAEQVLAEAADQAEWDRYDPVAALDGARARLARQLAEATPGEPPVAQMEQFIPAVMAVLPVVRTGIGLLGRERVVRFLAEGLANIIKGYIGPEAAKALARPIVDVGLRTLSLEAETPELLGAEAMVATLEDTVNQVLSLPEASLEEPLRLEAEMQEAFTEAAARYLPREALRADLPAEETAGEGGVWVLMPRRTRPCYRYRKYSRVYRVPISRPQARVIVVGEGETLEDRLLDAGARSWPVQAELHLYETLPGAHLGHLATFEGEALADEFEQLSPDAAALLVREPGLGRAATQAGPGRAPRQRLFRLVVPGVRLRRRRPRLVVRLDVAGARPALRIHLRLGERESHELAGRLAAAANAQVVALVRRLLGPTAQQTLAARLLRRSRRLAGGPMPADRAQALAAHVAEAMLATLAKELPAAAARLREAAQNPAFGLTLSFAFSFAGKADLRAGMPEPPSLTIRPGFHRD
jgi:hypothetical protein